MRAPLLSRGGVAATSRRSCEASFDGADGVVWPRKFLDHTFFDASPYRARASRPSARVEVAAQLFLDRAATPLLRMGAVTATFDTSPQFGQVCLSRRGDHSVPIAPA